ncbi:hypothetical protein FJT64_000863 [Amphibalanus amphitrite]|uniref:G-protein coupled receptors family 1 profile domain-containing protein n=1 Tax=Amphibalanus amphitrite TaxID=1232801 RepID=A0A6A4VKH1_AMPAM|nr:hypothetical protein FJT64_000863 [Amphibalanus amphitrite]
MDVLSGECSSLAHELLRCQERLGADNTSRPVCALRETETGAADTASVHRAFLAVIGVTVTLAIVLNLMVILTIGLNRELHTLVNYLTSLLCFNQLVWTIFPIMEIKMDGFLIEGLCALRHYVLQTTTSANFGLIVTITLLRYLMVVRNHSYPPNAQNMALFTIIAILPCVCRVLLFDQADNGLCGHFIAETPDGYIINTIPERKRQLRTFIILITEHIIGLGAIAFCYARILVKTFASGKRMIIHANEKLESGHPSQPTPMELAARVRVAEASSAAAESRAENGQVPEPSPASHRAPPSRDDSKTSPSAPLRPEPGLSAGVVLSVEELRPPPSASSPSPAPSSHGQSGTSQRRAGPRRGARTDVVATMAMVAFLVTFVVSFTPYVALIYYEKERGQQCLMMPDTRMYLMMVVIVSGGITAVFNPLVCVVFSRDFRKSFRHLRRKLVVWKS